jgi:hypothetical protein
MRTLIINSSNVVANTNNSVYKYNFPAGNVEFVKGQKLALGSIQMYYSTFNITAAQGNNSFSYVWVDGREITITIPDGFYEIDTLNDFLHFVNIQQGHYLTDTTGAYFYFVNFVINSSTYQININTYPISLTLYPVATYTIGAYSTATITSSSPATPVSWSRPTNPIMPMVRILANNFRNIVGFSAGFYPQGQTGYATTVPTVSLAQAAITITATSTFAITSIVGTALTTTGSPALLAGMVISGTGITVGTYIVSVTTANTFVVSVSQTVGAITGTLYSMSASQSPSYTVIQTFGSSAVPQVSPLSSYVLTCNLLNNNFAIPNSLLYSFSPTGVFGAQFVIAPNQYSFIDIQPGQYGSFQVSFLDQNNVPVAIQDNNLVILLIIADKGELEGLPNS